MPGYGATAYLPTDSSFSDMRASILLAALLVLASASASAGTWVIPADISVSMTAEPRTNLVTGQPIHFTITATNHGPLPAPILDIFSSEFVNEFDLSNATADCDGILALVAGDTEFGYFYFYDWIVVTAAALHPGKARTCHLTLPLSANAPAAFTFTWAIPDFFIDNDSSNNSASVTLRRATAAPATLPALSAPSLLTLGSLMLLLGWARLRGSLRNPQSDHSVA